MAGDPAKAREEMALCLNEAETAAQMRYGDGVRQQLEDLCIQKFEDNEEKWKDHAQSVLHAARFGGRFARLFAEFEGASSLRMDDVLIGLAIMKGICQERREHATDLRGGVEIFFAWCPDGVPAIPLPGRRV